MGLHKVCIGVSQNKKLKAMDKEKRIWWGEKWK